MSRKANDGRGRLGGRAAGTPNKNKSIKQHLREHSERYYEPNIEIEDANGEKRLVSQFDIDQAQLKPADRVRFEIDLLKYHTPQMQATSVDVSAESSAMSAAERLLRLSRGEEVSDNIEQ